MKQNDNFSFNDFDDINSSSSSQTHDDINLYTGNGEGSGDGQVNLNSFFEEQRPKEQSRFGFLKNRKGERKSGGKHLADADDSQKTHRKLRRLGRIALTVVLVGVITCGIGVGTVVAWLASEEAKGTFDMEEYDLNSSLDFTSTIYVKNAKSGEYEEYQRLHGMYNRIWVDSKDISPMLQNAFIAVEDKRFREHAGVDWKRTASAFINSFLPIYSGRQGGSTITQQLVKNLTDDRDVSSMRKVREIMRARYLENNYSKDSILEWYLNTIPMGTGIYGVEVAANYYFGKTANDLTIPECASLASITQEPEGYRPDLAENKEAHLKRRNTILRLMYSQKFITKQEYEDAVKTELKVVADKSRLNTDQEVYSDFVVALIDDVVDMLVSEKKYDRDAAEEAVYNGGYKIYATLNKQVQSSLEKVYTTSSYFSAPVSSKNGKTKPQSSMTVMDYEGHVVGIIGGRGKRKIEDGVRQLNRATSSPRQIGSSMKPIGVYALAMEYNEITYSSLVSDSQMSWADPSIKGGWPNNWDFSYRGRVPVEYAIYHSVNTTPVYILRNIIGNGSDNYSKPNNGLEISYDFLTTKLGLKHLTEADKNFSSLCLGGCAYGATSEEMAAAYAVFGNLGNYYKPTTYSVIYDQFGDVVDDTSKRKPIMAISEDTATVMNHLLQQVVKKGTGKGANVGNFDVYAKTGTTSDSQDLWFVGGTPYYVAACWYGFDNPKKDSPNGMSGYFSDGTAVSAAALRIWKEAMNRAHEGLPDKEFVDSEYAQELKYCTSTGLIANSGCSSAKGWYRADNIPDTCTHSGKTNDPKKKDGSKDDSSNTISTAATSSAATSSKKNSSKNSSAASSKAAAASSKAQSAASSKAQSTAATSQSTSSAATVSKTSSKTQ